jgi:hypothetical protein
MEDRELLQRIDRHIAELGRFAAVIDRIEVDLRDARRASMEQSRAVRCAIDRMGRLDPGGSSATA